MDMGVCTASHLATVKAQPVTPTARASLSIYQSSHMAVAEGSGPLGPVRTNTPGFLAFHPGVMKPSLTQAVSEQCQHALVHCLLFT